jgi:hypothetical protein
MSKLIFNIMFVAYVVIAYWVGFKVGMYYARTKAKWGSK